MTAGLLDAMTFAPTSAGPARRPTRLTRASASTSVARLYLEEMKGLARGRFALAGAAAVAALVAFVAALVAPEQLRAFGILTLLIVPSFAAPFAAARLASARATRLTHSLFTAPVSQRAWFAANVLVSLSAGALYLLALAPALLVVALHVGVEGELFQDLLPIGAGLLAFGAAFGSYLGVVFTGRGVGAAVGVATAFVLLSIMGAVFLPQLLAAQRPPELLIALLHVFPHVNLIDAASAGLHGDVVPDDPALSAAAVALGAFGFLALAAWTYLRHQGPEGWETTSARRGLLATIALALLVAPAAVGNADYEPARLPQFHAPPPGTGILAAVAERGADASRLDFLNPSVAAFEAPLEIGRANHRDVVVLIPAAPDAVLRNVTVEVVVPHEVRGERLRFSTTFDEIARDETVRMPGAAAEEARVLRIPLLFAPDEPRSLSKNFYRAVIDARYEVDGESEPRTGRATISLHAVVPDAGAQLLAASAPLPILLAGAAVWRRLRTR